MINKKLLSLISALSLTAVVGIATSASAASLGVELDYNEELSTGTEKVLDVYFSGASLISMISLDIDADCSYTNTTYTLLTSGKVSQWNPSDMVLVWEDGTYAGVDFGNDPHGRVTISVPEGTEAFNVNVAALEAMDATFTMYGETMGNVTLPGAITIPGATVEEPEEEPVVINAEDAGMFTYWQDAPVAQAFFANLTAEQAAKDSIVWTVTDGTPEKTKTEVANIDTEVSGESGVVLGLVVSNAVEGLTATVTVK